MALSALSGDETRIVFETLCNPLDPRIAVAFSSVSHGLRDPTQALRLQLMADHEAATALCHKAGLRSCMRSCKELREAKMVTWVEKGLSASELATLGSLGSVLPMLEDLKIIEGTEGSTAGPDGAQRLAAGLGAGALPAVTCIGLTGVHMSDAGASALAAAMGRGALPRLKTLVLDSTDIGDAGLVALAPALRRLPALEIIHICNCSLGDEGVAALVAPPPPVSAPKEGLTKLKMLFLRNMPVSDAGCAALTAALNLGALSALKWIDLDGIPANTAAQATVREALARSVERRVPSFFPGWSFNIR